MPIPTRAAVQETFGDDEPVLLFQLRWLVSKKVSSPGSRGLGFDMLWWHQKMSAVGRGYFVFCVEDRYEEIQGEVFPAWFSASLAGKYTRESGRGKETKEREAESGSTNVRPLLLL